MINSKNEFKLVDLKLVIIIFIIIEFISLISYSSNIYFTFIFILVFYLIWILYSNIVSLYTIIKEIRGSTVNSWTYMCTLIIEYGDWIHKYLLRLLLQILALYIISKMQYISRLQDYCMTTTLSSIEFGLTKYIDSLNK